MAECPVKPSVDDVWGDSDNIDYKPKLITASVPVVSATDDPLAEACLVYEPPRQKEPVKAPAKPQVIPPKKNQKKKKKFPKTPQHDD
jgi:hypothetical protein